MTVRANQHGPAGVKAVELAKACLFAIEIAAGSHRIGRKRPLQSACRAERGAPPRLADHVSQQHKLAPEQIQRRTTARTLCSAPGTTKQQPTPPAPTPR